MDLSFLYIYKTKRRIIQFLFRGTKRFGMSGRNYFIKRKNKRISWLNPRSNLLHVKLKDRIRSLERSVILCNIIRENLWSVLSYRARKLKVSQRIRFSLGSRSRPNTQPRSAWAGNFGGSYAGWRYGSFARCRKSAIPRTWQPSRWPSSANSAR